jgi:GT2 family glycosyltransferase
VSSLESGQILAPAPPSPVKALAELPTFSIVIPAYQAAGTIATAVGSALDQVYPAHEVIVVDDGSTDDLEEALRPFADRIRLIHKENGGGASALNRGAEAASGDFLALLDADDAFHPRRLETLAALARIRPDLDLVTTDAGFVVDGRQVSTFVENNPFAIDDQRAAILESCFVGGWPAIRLGRLRAIGGFDENLRTGYDWDCWARVILAGGRAGLVNRPYYDYALHPGSLTSSRVSALWDRVRLLEKACRDPALAPEDEQVLMRSIRRHRTRAVLAEAEAALYSSGPRRRLAKRAVAPGIEMRGRMLAALTVAAPALARRAIPRYEPPEERFAPGQ